MSDELGRESLRHDIDVCAHRGGDSVFEGFIVIGLKDFEFEGFEDIGLVIERFTSEHSRGSFAVVSPNGAFKFVESLSHVACAFGIEFAFVDRFIEQFWGFVWRVLGAIDSRRLRGLIWRRAIARLIWITAETRDDRHGTNHVENTFHRILPSERLAPRLRRR